MKYITYYVKSLWYTDRMISKIALVVFLISVAVFNFVPGAQPVAGAVAGVAAIVGAIALIAEK